MTVIFALTCKKQFAKAVGRTHAEHIKWLINQHFGVRASGQKKARQEPHSVPCILAGCGGGNEPPPGAKRLDVCQASLRRGRIATRTPGTDRPRTERNPLIAYSVRGFLFSAQI